MKGSPEATISEGAAGSIFSWKNGAAWFPRQAREEPGAEQLADQQRDDLASYEPEVLVEEAIARAAEDWNAGRRNQISTLAGRILQKVRDALRGTIEAGSMKSSEG